MPLSLPQHPSHYQPVSPRAICFPRQLPGPQPSPASHAQAQSQPHMYPYASYVYMANNPSFAHFTADIGLPPSFSTYPPVIYQQPEQFHGSAASLVLPPFVTTPGANSALPTVAGSSSPHLVGGIGSSGAAIPSSVGGLVGAPAVVVNSASAQPNNKEWFEYLLQLAHSKYNSQDYSGALAILQELYNVNQTHLPTLLLLGCTCYSLNLHSLSIYYNKLILNLQPQFAEAYSNLGTTHRALAQNAAKSSPAPLASVNPGSDVSPVPTDPATNLQLAEHYYRVAISIRPKYWDASINLAGLLSTQGRWREAIDVYQAIESLIECEFLAEERFDTLTIAGVAANPAHAAVSPPDIDAVFAQLVFEREKHRRTRISFLEATGGVVPGQASGFTVERRRDLYFAKGNLFFALGDLAAAKQEYLKGLVSVGIDVASVFEGSKLPTIPPPTVTPEQVQALVKQRQLQPNASHHPTTSSILQTLAKIYQDANFSNMAIKFYYLSLGMFPTANTCNNLGILLAPQRIQESIRWYEVGLLLDPNHVHLYTNLGSALKDRGQLDEGISCYQRAIALHPDFYIALANLANVLKDLGRVDEAIRLYRRALDVKPDFVEAFCNYVNSLLFVCAWESRDENLRAIRDIVAKQLADGAKTTPRGVPTVLPFHTFTYSSLPVWMVREISRRNAERVFWNATTSTWFPGFPERPRSLATRALMAPGHLISNPVASASSSSVSAMSSGSSSAGVQQAAVSPQELAHALDRSLFYPYPYPLPPPAERISIGYISSDFTNHPLAHLMQSVFGMHDKSRFRVVCYSLSPSDNSPYRATIEAGADLFLDVSQWSTQQIVERIAQVDHIHVLCNLNGYTKGGRNEIFAARPAPIQIALMGFAGTMGAGRVNDPEHPDPADADPADAAGIVEDEGYAGDDDSDVVSGKPAGSMAAAAASSADEDLAFFDNLKTRWIDYMVVDEIACPQKFVCGEPLPADETVPAGKQLIERGPVAKDDDRNRIYTEAMIYMPHSFFVNDHRQGFREQEDGEIDRIIRELDAGAYGWPGAAASGIDQQHVPTVSRECEPNATPAEMQHWRKEQMRRLKMRHELFPWLAENTVVFANFNQLYKVDPDIFATWMRILQRVPNSILWLLRFPPAGEAHLRRRAVELVGEDTARRLIFTGELPAWLSWAPCL
nr:hypothetical protein HK105_002573 [Polyrhizophydium stewartii]